MFSFAEVLHYSPRDIDCLTVEEFNMAVEYIDQAIKRQQTEERVE